MSYYIRSIHGTPRQCKSQAINPIQFNIMSTMSELDRLMKELYQEDMLHQADLKELATQHMNDLYEAQADEAYALEQAMRNEMDPPADEEDDLPITWED